MKDLLAIFSRWTKIKARLHTKAAEPVFFREREIWWAQLGLNIGHEQHGKHYQFERPVLILRKFNKELLWALPMTTQVKSGKYYFQTRYRSQRYSIVLSQIRTISSKRLSRKIRTLPQEDFQGVKKAFKNLL